LQQSRGAFSYRTIAATSLNCTGRELGITAALSFAPFDPDFRGLAQRIHAAVESAAELKNQVIRVNRTAP
jgi:hypothetical protein